MRLPIRILILITCARASLEGWDSICASGNREKVKRCAADLAETIRGCGGRRLVPATKCTNLAVAGAASQAVNWALMLAGGLAQHVHTRTVASLLTAKDFSINSRPKGMSGPRFRNRPRLGLNDIGRPTCFFWTLREPAKRIESGYRHAVQLMASHPLFSVRRPPPLDNLMASWRANATRRPRGIQENFFRTQVGYLKGGLSLCRRKAIQIIPLCTETLADDWAAAATRVLGDPDARLPQANARAIDSDPRLRKESTLSYENRRWVNEEAFLADHVVWQALCGRNASTPYAPTQSRRHRLPVSQHRCSPHNRHLPGCHWLPGKCRWQCNEPPR